MTTFDEETERQLNKAAERAVGMYYVKTKQDFDMVMEALDAAKIQLDKLPGVEQDISELKSDMVVVKHALQATNQDLRQTNRDLRVLKNSTSQRLARLEAIT